MPGEPREYLRYATAPDPPEIDAVRWEDGTPATPEEFRDIVLLRAYAFRQIERRRRRASGPQRRALRLLRSLLSGEQLRQLRSNREFLATAASGNTYRIDPRRGITEQVTRHGRRWFVLRRFCLHDSEEGKMPAADLAIAHLLLLLSDEAEFLRLANATYMRDQLWNADYRRRLREARALREEARDAG